MQKAFILLLLVGCISIHNRVNAAPILQEKSSVFVWLSGAPILLISNQKYLGVRGGLGADVFFQPSRKVSVGMFVSKPLVDEEMTGAFEGWVRRLSFMPNLSYYFKPDEMWARLGIGVSYLKSSNANLVDKMKPTIGVSWGVRNPISEKFSFGFEIGYEHTPPAKTSIFPFMDMFSCVVGDCEGAGVFPAAHMVHIGFVIGLENYHF